MAGGKDDKSSLYSCPCDKFTYLKKNEEKMAELFENSRDTELKNDALKIVEHFIEDRPGV